MMKPETAKTFSMFEGYIKNMPRAELGGLIKEYIAESNHSGWDGFSSRDLTGIRRLLEDIMLYHQSVGQGETADGNDISVQYRHEHFTRLSNVSPVE